VPHGLANHQHFRAQHFLGACNILLLKGVVRACGGDKTPLAPTTTQTGHSPQPGCRRAPEVRQHSSHDLTERPVSTATLVAHTDTSQRSIVHPLRTDRTAVPSSCTPATRSSRRPSPLAMCHKRVSTHAVPFGPLASPHPCMHACSPSLHLSLPSLSATHTHTTQAQGSQADTHPWHRKASLPPGMVHRRLLLLSLLSRRREMAAVLSSPQPCGCVGSLCRCLLAVSCCL